MTETELRAVRARDFFAREHSDEKIASWPSECIQGEYRPTPPAVTVVIPAYKKPELLRGAVQSALEQEGFADYQVLVVDDDPTPGGPVESMLAQLACEKLICYRNRRNLGLFSNWNRCFALAQSEWVVMLHDDDLLCRDHLAGMMAAAHALPKAAVVGSPLAGYPTEQADEPTRRRLCAPGSGPLRADAVGDWWLQFGGNLPCQGSLIRREAWAQIGGVHVGERLVGGAPIGGYYSEDYCTMVRLVQTGPAYWLSRPLYRVGLGQNSSQNVQEWQDALIVQYYCGLFLAARRGLMADTARRSTQSHLLRLLHRYNSGEGYFGCAAGIDEAAVRAVCGLPERADGLAAADKRWDLYEKLCRAAGRLRGKILDD